MLMVIGRLIALAVFLFTAAPQLLAARGLAPNVILIFCDDMGYSDIGRFRPTGYDTPNIDRLIKEGITFTDFQVGQSVCSPSRAALLTGCYPTRVNVTRNFNPESQNGLSLSEITIPELMRIRGYSTAIYGKWHLGHTSNHLPTRQGFDEWFGLPYSNDMWPLHPTRPDRYPELPLMLNENVINPALQPEDQEKLTSQYNERTVEFIEKNKSRPFFIYLAHSMPHVPLFASEEFKDKSDHGRYGDVIEEIDHGVGQIISTLRKNGLDRKTLIIFTSDNGPWLSYGKHAGSAGLLREGKGTVFEGGFRVPCVMRWPGQIPAGRTCNELASTIDILPTIAKLLRMPLPGDRTFDGKDITPLMLGQAGARSPHESFLYYSGEYLRAVRSGPWKLVFPHTYSSLETPGENGLPGTEVKKKIELSLFNLVSDVGETKNVAEQNPKTVKRLEAIAEEARIDLGDGLRRGTNIRAN